MNAVSALLLIYYVPESPKFTFSQGDEEKTLAILRDIFRRNTGKAVFQYEVKCLAKDDEFNAANTKASQGFLQFMWTQTTPLFKHPHLKNTFTACYLQFATLLTINGFWTFFPEIQNKVYLWMGVYGVDAKSTVCDILSTNQTTSIVRECTSRMEINIFINITMISFLYIIGWTVCSLVIDYTGKLLIIVLIMVFCGACSISMMFVDVPRIAVYLYVVLQTAGLNMTVVNSSTVELYPTNLR